MSLIQNGYIVTTVYNPYYFLNPVAVIPDPGGGLPSPRRQPKKKPRSPKKLQTVQVTINPPWHNPTSHLSEHEMEACLRHYQLTQEQLKGLGYPIESEQHKGRALIHNPFPPHEIIREPRCSDSGSSCSEGDDDPSLTDATVRSIERRCSRCSRGFFMVKNTYLTTERCCYHWGKPQRHVGYTCCKAPEGAPGCVSAKLHVWSGVEVGVTGPQGPLEGFVITQPAKNRSNGFGVFAIDCEMCFTAKGLELCKVSVVGLDGQVYYNTHVKPDTQVIDFNTRFSGVTSKDLANSASVKTLQQVQQDLLEFISAETVLLGHGLENDLKSLKIIHGCVVDTAVAFPHPFGLPYRLGLRTLVKDYLKREIQTASHDSVQDAQACIDLMRYRLNCDYYNVPTI